MTFEEDFQHYRPNEIEQDKIDLVCQTVINNMSSLNLPQKATALQSLMSSFEDTLKVKVFDLNTIPKSKVKEAIINRMGRGTCPEIIANAGELLLTELGLNEKELKQ